MTGVLQTPAAQAEGQSASGKDVELHFRYDLVAKLYAGAFFLTLLCGGIVTFTSTAFDFETDKILAFYGMFNPCIFFDHYPAKALAMSGMGVFILLGIWYSCMVFVDVYLRGHLFTTIWTGMLMTVIALVQLCFVNVFTTNLYPMETERRRLHGAHADVDGRMSLVEGFSGLSAEDQDIIELHTGFYALWLLSEALLMFTLQRIRVVDNARGLVRAESWKVKAFFIVGIAGVLLHAITLIVMIVQNRPMVEWYARESLQSSLHNTIVFVDMKTMTSAWGWVPVMCYRMLLHIGEGLHMTVSTTRNEHSQGEVNPKWWLGRGLRMAALTLMLGGVFYGGWEVDGTNTTSFKLASPLLTRPWGYIATPILLGSVFLIWVGIAMTCIEQEVATGQVQWPIIGVGMCFGACCFASLLVILEQQRFVAVVFATNMVLYPAWIMMLSAASRSNMLKGAVYSACGAALIVSAQLLEEWPLFFAFMVWMCLYDQVITSPQPLHISVRRLDTPENVYAEISTLPAGENLKPVAVSGSMAQQP